MVRDKLKVSLRPSLTAPEVHFTGAGACHRQDCSLVAEADHRIANHLSLLAGHVRLQAAKIARQAEAPTHDAVQLLLLRFDAEISAVARLHRQLSAGKWRAPADVADELREVCAPFRSGLSGAATVIEDFERGCTVTPDQILPLTQIVTEAITNALKHAYAGERNGVIRVNLRKAGDGAAVVEIVDHGWGFPVGFNPVTDGGLGFRVVRALAEQLHAAVAFDSSGEGVRFRLTLPPPA